MAISRTSHTCLLVGVKFTSVRAVRGIFDEPLHDLKVLFCDLAAGDDDVFLAIKSDNMDSSLTINSLKSVLSITIKKKS